MRGREVLYSTKGLAGISSNELHIVNSRVGNPPNFWVGSLQKSAPKKADKSVDCGFFSCGFLMLKEKDSWMAISVANGFQNNICIRINGENSLGRISET